MDTLLYINIACFILKISRKFSSFVRHNRRGIVTLKLSRKYYNTTCNMPVYDLHASTQEREYPHEAFLKENGIYTFFSKPCYVCRESVLSSTTIVTSSEAVMEVFPIQYSYCLNFNQMNKISRCENISL